jgi:protein SCO1/2
MTLAAIAWGASPEVPQGTELPAGIKDVGIDQKLDAQLPMDAMFRDESGVSKPLGEYFRNRPVILAFVFYECPMLCNMVLNGLMRTVRPMTLSAGKDYDVIAISFDPTETASMAERKRFEYLERYNRQGAGESWRFLTGDQESIRRVTDAAGFRYKRDPESGKWSHASGIMVATPQGKLSHYFYGVEYSARDLRFALVESAQGRIGNAVDQVLLYCFHYDPKTGKYGVLVNNVLRGGGLLTVGALVSFWVVNFLRGRRRKFEHVERVPITS